MVLGYLPPAEHDFSDFDSQFPPECDWAIVLTVIGLVLSNNWAGFVMQTWQP